ncbi:histone-lysine N-methyltransferase SETMAR [Trichonephila clavipes]|nr:histone-lysine N-methyltransferase SETMAR [Trichonephila clavipes]
MTMSRMTRIGQNFEKKNTCREFLNRLSSEAKWTYRRSSFGVVYFTTSKRAYQSLHQVAEYVKRLGIVLSMNALNDEALQATIEKDSSQMCGELTRQFDTSSEAIRLHLHRLVQDNLCTQIRLCFVSGGFVIKWFTVSCYQQANGHYGPVFTAIGTCTTGTASEGATLVNRNWVLLLHENRRMHVGWETLCHPPYSPDLAPSDYHIFHSLDNHLRGKFFTNEADMRQAHTDFASHTSEFDRKGFEQLETRWQKVLDADGDYFED